MEEAALSTRLEEFLEWFPGVSLDRPKRSSNTPFVASSWRENGALYAQRRAKRLR
jgi:hypothetical protein